MKIVSPAPIYLTMSLHLSITFVMHLWDRSVGSTFHEEVVILNDKYMTIIALSYCE